MEDHINVAIRIRPLSQREVRNSTTVALNQLPWHVNRDTIIQRQYHDGRFSQGNSYTFDKVFDQKDTTQKVYDNSVKGIIQSTLAGFNGTIFAYGQTSSGKTHTMHGSEVEPGIIKLAVRDMFSKIAQDERREYLLRVSFLEIYNEVLRDLLEPSKASLKIHENAKREIFVGDLSEHIVFNAEQVEELLAKGDRNRHIAGTNMNERSSRSHTIFRIVAESREKSEAGSADSSSQDGDMDVDQEKHHQRLSSGSLGETGEFTGAVMVSCLNLVDLAGSERVGLTGAEGQRLKEGGHINKSLLSLSTVIARLSEDGGDRGHIPYRDSKLTRILQPSLGGNARTLIICTITPAQDYVEESLSTLKFASRAKTIQNKPEVNEELRGDALLRRLKRASELEKEVAQMRDLEKKKNKIEADNEVLLRQLWKSQKERERLQKELEQQQSKMFAERPAGNDKGPVDAALTPRRQTWFPGLQRSTDGGTMPINFTNDSEDDDSSPEPQTSGNVQRNNAVDQAVIDRVSELETQNDALQQTQAEMTKENREMEATIQRFMRENNLLLSTLGQLAAADTIPPSPAKGDLTAAQPPREVVQVRRKLRALITTLDASQRQCQKFRTQRPEAEFLELELQAVRETLVEKEEHMVDLMRESDDVLARCQEAESAVSELQRKHQELQDELSISKESGVDARRMVVQLRMEAEMLQRQHEMDLAKQLSNTTQSMEQNQARFQAEISLLESKIASQTERIESMSIGSKQHEESHEIAIAQLQKLADKRTANIERLERELADAQARIALAENERDALANVQTEAEARQSQVEQLDAAHNQALAQISELTETISRLESESRKQLDASEQKAAEAADLRTALDGLRSTLSNNDIIHAKEIAEQKRAIEDLTASHTQAKQALDEQMEALAEQAALNDAKVAALSDKLQQAEADKAQLETNLAQTSDKASAIPLLQQEADRLKNELAELHAAYDQASELLSARQNELDSSVEERAHLQTKIEDLESQNADVWERVSELTLTNENLAGNAAGLEGQVASRDAQLTEAIQERDLARTQHEELIAKHADTLAAAEETSSKLQSALDAKAADAESLSQKLEVLQDENHKLTEKLEQVSAQVSDLEVHAAKAVQQLEDSSRKTESLEEELARANSTISHESEKAKGLTSQLEELVSEASRLRAELDESQASYGTAVAYAETLESEVAAVNGALLQTKTSLQSAESKLEALRAEHAAVNTELADATRNLVDERTLWESTLSSKDAELHDLVDKLDSAVAGHQREISDWQARESKSQQAVAKLEIQLAAARDRLATLETEMAETDESKSAIASLNAELRNKLEETESSLRDAQEEIGKLTSAVGEADSTLAAATKGHAEAAEKWATERKKSQGTVAELEESLAKVRAALDESTSSYAVQTAELESQIAAGHDAIVQLESAVSGLESQSSSLRSQLKSAEKQRDDLQETSRQLQEELESANADLESRTSAFESQINSSRECIAQLESALAELESKSTGLCQQLELAGIQHDAAQESERQLRQELELAKSELAAKAAEAESGKSAVNAHLEQKESLQRLHDAKVADLESTIQQLSAERTKLSTDLKDVQGRLESAVSVGQRLNDALSERKGEIDRMKAEQTKSTKQLTQLAARLAALQSDLMATSEEKAEIQVLLKQLQQDVEQKSTELADSIAREAELTSAVSELNARITQAESSRSTLVTSMDKERSGYTDEIRSLRRDLDDKADQLQSLERQVDELRRQKEESGSRLSDTERLLHESESKLQASTEMASDLKAELGKQSKLRAIAEKEAAGRIGSLEAEVEGLCDQLLAKSTEADAATTKLTDARSEISEISMQHSQLKSSYQALEERTKDIQSALEQTIAEIKRQLTQKEVDLKEAEEELLSANAKASQAHKDARSQIAVLEAKAQEMEQTITGLNTTVAELRAELKSKSLEQASNSSSLADTATRGRLATEDSVHEAAEMIESLTAERDRAREGIDLLKSMMTELAQVKNDEIAELDSKLAQHQELLEIAVKEGLEKDRSLERAEQAAKEQVDGYKAELNKAAASSKEAITQLTSQRDELLKELDSMKQANLEASKQLADVQSEADKLHAAAGEAELKLAEATRALAEAASSSTKAASISSEGTARLQQEIEKLQTANAKLEKKNLKLRDIYTADITRLHAEEEEQREAVVQLKEVLAESEKKTKAVEEELQRVKSALSERQQQQQTKNAPIAVPIDRRPKASMARLASDRTTAAKDDVKRLHLSRDLKAAGPLSPVPQSRLNSRMVNMTQGTDQTTAKPFGGFPARKRTATPSTATAAAAGKSPTKQPLLAARARSSYGERRRMRRNQTDPTAGNTLEDQAAEQCVQQ